MAVELKRRARRSFLAALAVTSAVAIVGHAPEARAQAYPNKPVKLVVPFVAGGATDIVARLVAQKLTSAWGQSVVVENRGGAGGNIGAEAVVKSAPDGYTILVTSGSIVTVNPHMYAKMPFDAKKRPDAHHQPGQWPSGVSGEPIRAGQECEGIDRAGQRQTGAT